MRGADFNANAATGAILHVELQSEKTFGMAAGVDRSGLKSGWYRLVGIHEPGAIVEFGADDRMWTGKGALAALDTGIGFPDRHLIRDIAFFPGGCPQRECAIDRHRTDGQFVAPSGHNRSGNPLHEFRS